MADSSLLQRRLAILAADVAGYFDLRLAMGEAA